MSSKKTYNYNEACLLLKISARDQRALRKLHENETLTIKEWKFLFQVLNVVD